MAAGSCPILSSCPASTCCLSPRPHSARRSFPVAVPRPLSPARVSLRLQRLISLLTLNVPLKSNPALDALLDRLARLAEDALRGLAAGRNVLGKRVRRDDEGDDALVIGRRVDGELGLATAALGSMSSVWLRSAFSFLVASSWELHYARRALHSTTSSPSQIAEGPPRPSTQPQTAIEATTCPCDRNRSRGMASWEGEGDGRASRKLRSAGCNLPCCRGGRGRGRPGQFRR